MRRHLSFQFMASITVTLVVVLTLNLVWAARSQREQLQRELRGKAALVAQQLIATRLFIARNQDRINRCSAGHEEFKGLNPAAVGRGINAVLTDLTAGYQFKQTRLNVRIPENAPDDFDRTALLQFAAEPRLTELWGEVQQGESTVFRYAVPLWADRACLSCHGEPRGSLDIAGYVKEGMSEGELAGAISIAMPMDEALAFWRQQTLRQGGVIIALAVLSLLLIYALTRQLVAGPVERLAGVAASIGSGRLAITEHDTRDLRTNAEMAVLTDAMLAMSRGLQELYANLERKVDERTGQLQEANQRLQDQQAELQRINNELERAHRLKSEILTMMSHEFRTPLTAIISFTELLLKQSVGHLNPEQYDYLVDVLESSHRLMQMINDLLDLSRLEAGRIQLFQEAVDPLELIDEVQRTVRPLVTQRRIRLVTDLPPGLPLVYADPLRVRQVLLNLLSNALKFTPEGGDVTISARWRREDGLLEVAVRDTGIGIAPDDQAGIFEAFRRAANSERPHLHGTGLGLALARNLLELHGGQIWVESAPGRGSTFFFTLPVLPDPPEDE